MEDKIKVFGTLLILCIAIILTFLGLGIHIGHKKAVSEMQFSTKTDTVTIHDTVTIQPSENPSVKDSVIGSEPELVPITVHDTCWIHDTCYVYLAIEHHHTNVPDIADIWYLGFNARIDSMRFYQQTQYITERVEVQVPGRQYNNTVSIVAGFEDASLMYTRNLGRFVIGVSAGYTYDRHPTARGVVGFSF